MRKVLFSLLLVCGVASAQTKVDLQHQVKNILAQPNGGTGQDTSAVTGCPKVTAGTWSFSAANCGSGPGGSGPGGVPQSIQFQIDATTFGGSKATLTENGDLVSLTTNGVPSAFLSQTNPTSNDGIVNELQNAGTVGEAGENYDGTEWPAGPSVTPYWRTPFGTNGVEKPPPSIAVNTTLFDQRQGSVGSVWYDPSPNYPNNYQMILSDQVTQKPGGGDQWSVNETFHVVHCCGKNEENFDGDQTVHQMFNWFFVTQASGISSPLSIQDDKYSDGDDQGINLDLNFSGATHIGSDEGHEAFRVQALQNNFPAYFTVTSTSAKGATTIPLANIGGVLPGEGNFLTLPLQAGPVLHATALTIPFVGGTSNPGTITVLETLTPDTIGTFVANINVPQQYNGATTNEVINLTNLTAAIVKNSTFPTACVNNAQFNEEAAVVSVGTPSGTSPNITQQVTLALRHSYNGTDSSGYVTQGPNACKGLELLANQFYGYAPAGTNCPTSPTGLAPCPIRYMAKVIGATSAHVLSYSMIEAGNWDTVLIGGVHPSGDIPIPTLSRTGNVVTLSTTGDDLINVQGDHVIVSGCSDSSYNGTFGPVTQTLSPAQITWANAGANGTTTGCNPLALVAQNGQPANGFQMMPAMNIVQAENPSTLDQTAVVVEANNYQVSTTDSVEAQPSGEIVLNQMHVLVGLDTPSSASNPFVDYQWGMIGQIPDGMKLFNYFFGNILPSMLVGGGGTRLPSATLINLASDPGVFSNWINGGGMQSNGSMFTQVGCGAYSCTDPTYLGWNTFNFVSGTANYLQQWFPAEFESKTSVAGPGNNTQFIQTDTGFTLENNGTANTVLTLGSGTVDLIQGGLLSGSSYFDEQKLTLSTYFNQITNQTSGAQTTLTQTTAGFTLTGGPTAVGAGSTENGLAIPTVGTPAAGQAACIKTTATGSAALVIGQCSTVVSSSGGCTCI